MWYYGIDLLGFNNEKIINQNMSVENTVEMILGDINDKHFT